MASITHRPETETVIFEFAIMSKLTNYRQKRYGLFPRGTLQVARTAYNAYRLGSKIHTIYKRRFKKHGRYGIGLTNQYDRARVYSKKRMPYRKRKRWGRFIKKVRAAENATLGTRTRVFNNRILIDTPSLGTGPQPPLQLFRSVCLYSNKDSGSESTQLAQVRNDLSKLLSDDTDVAQSGKVQMISGIFDMTLVNASLDALGNPMGIELDVYVIIAKKRFEWKNQVGTATSGSVEGMLQDGSDVAGTLSGSSSINYSNIGATPFDFTTGLSNGRMKILKKTKYFLPSGNQMTYQMRDPKNRHISKDMVENIGGTNLPGVTKHLLLVAKGLPGAATDPGGSETNQYKVRLEVGCTRKYAYKFNEDDSDKTGFN